MKSLSFDAVKVSAAAAPLCVLLACPALADPLRYTVKDIFPLDEDSGLSAVGHQINNAGQVVVTVAREDESEGVFLYDDRDGSTIRIPEAGLIPTDMNELGAVAGFEIEGLTALVYADGMLTTIVPFRDGGTFINGRNKRRG